MRAPRDCLRGGRGLALFNGDISMAIGGVRD